MFAGLLLCLGVTGIMGFSYTDNVSSGILGLMLLIHIWTL